MKNLIFGDKALSKWLIFLIDQVIVSWSVAVSFFIVIQFEFQELLRGNFLIYAGTYTLISIAVFLKMRIHTGIIRYSNTHDILRIFSAVSLSTVIYILAINFVIIPYFHLTWNKLYLAILLNFFTSTSLLIMLRISVKSFFNFINNKNRGDKKATLIYGSGSSALLVKQALEIHRDVMFDVIGFIDDNPDKVNMHIEQKKVFSSSELTELRNKWGVEKMVVLSDTLNTDHQRYTIDKCIELGIKIITVPPTDQWLYGKLQLNQLKDLKIEDLLQREPIILKKNNILNEIKGKRVLITGAAGSIGSEIVRQVMSYNPEQIIVCDQAESPLHELQLEMDDNNGGTNYKVVMANIQNRKRMWSLFDQFKPQIVFHAAAYKHVPLMENNPGEAILTNVLGTKNLADLSIEFKVEKFIMISTDKAVNPTNVMGASKRIAEIYIQALNRKFSPNLKSSSSVLSGHDFQTKFITTRFGNVLGSNGSVLPRFKAQIAKGGPITVTDPEITRYFMTIPEAVQLVMEAAAMGKGGEIFIFDMGKPVKIVELARNMIKLSGLVPDKDIKIVFTGLRPGEKLYEELLNAEEHNIPTHHQKIKISEVITYPYDYVMQVIGELIELNKATNDYEVVRKMKEIVPEYKSNNSVYEELDTLTVFAEV
ncbi:MAG: polysaccharide biosynthesis protein [Daejeonella sp.]|nr:polysaccharide biosynthesis protein [Daejeonella sp.]